MARPTGDLSDEAYRQFFVRPPSDAAVPPTALRELPLALASLLVVAGALVRFWGWPHLPSGLSSWSQTLTLLGQGQVPEATLVAVGALLLWALCLYLAGTLLLRLLLALADVLTRGARWVQALQVAVDWISLPLVRRVADRAVIVATVFQLTSRAVPTAAAAGPTPLALTVTVTQGEGRPEVATGAPAESTGGRWRRVQPGDTLHQLAARYLHDPERWREIAAANVGQVMADGVVYPPTNEIKDGWMLRIPAEQEAPVRTAAADQQRVTRVIVRRGDCLWRIAQRVYGDAALWPRIWAANRGEHVAAVGKDFTDPELIWPGQELTIPAVAAVSAPPVVAPTTVPPSAAAPPSAPQRPVRQPSSPAVPTATHTVAVPRPGVPPAVAPAAPSHLAPRPRPSAVPPAGTAAPNRTIAPSTALPIATAAHLPAPAPPVRPAAALGAPAVPRADGTTSSLPTETLALVGAAVAVVGVGLRRWRLGGVRRARPDGGRQEVHPGFPMVGNYAESELPRLLARRRSAGEGAPAVQLALEVDAFLRRHGFPHAEIVAAEQPCWGGPSLLLRLDFAAAHRLVAQQSELERWLETPLALTVDAERDVRLTVQRRGQLHLSRRQDGTLPLLPLAVLPVRTRHGQGAVWYGNWEAMGHTLVAGPDAAGVGRVLTSLVCGLVTATDASDVRCWTIAERERLPEALDAVPALGRGRIDPGDLTGVETLLHELVATLDQRPVEAERSARQVLIVAELTALSETALATLERLFRLGSRGGVQVLAATTQAARLPVSGLEHYPSRLVFPLGDDALTERLLGRPPWDGAGSWSAGPAAQIGVCLAGRAALLAYPYWVTPERLAELVLLCRAVPAVPLDPPPALVTLPVEVARAQEDERTPIGAEAITAAKAGVAGPVEEIRPPDSGAAAPIQVMCFGGFRVLGRGALIVEGGAALQQTLWGIFAQLAVAPHGQVAVGELFEAYWRGPDDAILPTAATNLRSMLRYLRTALRAVVPDLPSRAIQLQQEFVTLDPSWISADVQVFDQVWEAAKTAVPQDIPVLLERAIALYRGPLLEGASCPWLDTRTRGPSRPEEYEGRFFVAVRDLANLHLHGGEPERAIRLYEDTLRTFPAWEDVARELYRSYGAVGDRQRLLRAHAALVRAVELAFPDCPELDPTTTAVYQDVLARLMAAGCSPVPVLASLAVGRD